MFRKLLFPSVTSVSCLGLGIYIGTRYEKRNIEKEFYIETLSKNNQAFPREQDRGLLFELNHGFISPLPSVSAASSGFVPVLSGSPDSMPRDLTSSGLTSKAIEIMRFGFPSYENIRTHNDYVLSYDRRNRTANWVFEHITPENVKYRDGVGREECLFKEDETIHPYFRSTNADYFRSGYDRGHLAPAANHRSSQQAMNQTFFLSNISPQVGTGFNRDAWAQLEKFVRHLCKIYPNVYVCTGPLYLPRQEADGKLYVKYEVIGKNHVAVPTHFFKVVVCETNTKVLELLSFVMPNQVLPEKVDLKSYLVPIESIERASGFLLFDKIPKTMFKKINGKNN